MDWTQTRCRCLCLLQVRVHTARVRTTGGVVSVTFCTFTLPPPLVVPHPLSFPWGGGGHLVNPKFFVAAHCVVVWVTVLWGTATCIPCTHGRTFCSLSLKWNLIAQPCFPLVVDRFSSREGVTTCRISSYSKGGTEQFLEALVRRYRANIHRVFRRFVLWVSGC